MPYVYEREDTNDSIGTNMDCERLLIIFFFVLAITSV